MIFFSHLCISCCVWDQAPWNSFKWSQHHVMSNKTETYLTFLGLKSLTTGKELLFTPTHNPPFLLAYITSHNCFVMCCFWWLPFRFSGLLFRATVFHESLVKLIGSNKGLERLWWGASLMGNISDWKHLRLNRSKIWLPERKVTCWKSRVWEAGLETKASGRERVCYHTFVQNMSLLDPDAPETRLRNTRQISAFLWGRDCPSGLRGSGIPVDIWGS